MKHIEKTETFILERTVQNIVYNLLGTLMTQKSVGEHFVMMHCSCPHSYTKVLLLETKVLEK
jgi:hypothetical protein